MARRQRGDSHGVPHRVRCFRSRGHLGNLETRVLADELHAISIDNPIYVTSLARAGTTIVTEMLESHPDLSCHHYSDFPNPWTPFWRNYLLQHSRRQPPEASVRAHRDRILVSQDSPEAVEEVLWMGFFENLHDSTGSNVLDGQTIYSLVIAGLSLLLAAVFVVFVEDKDDQTQD